MSCEKTTVSTGRMERAPRYLSCLLQRGVPILITLLGSPVHIPAVLTLVSPRQDLCSPSRPPPAGPRSPRLQASAPTVSSFFSSQASHVQGQVVISQNLCSLSLNHSRFSRILLHKLLILCWIFPFYILLPSSPQPINDFLSY